MEITREEEIGHAIYHELREGDSFTLTVRHRVNSENTRELSLTIIERNTLGSREERELNCESDSGEWWAVYARPEEEQFQFVRSYDLYAVDEETDGDFVIEALVDSE